MNVWFKEQFNKNRISIVFILTLNIIGMSFNIFLPLLMRYLIDNILEAENLTLLVNFSLTIIFLFTISNILDIIGKRWYCSIIMEMKKDLKERLFNHIQKLSVKNYQKISKGDYISRILNDSTSIVQIINDYLYPSLLSIISLIAVIMILIKMNITLTVCCLISVPIFIVTSKYFGKKTKDILDVIKIDNAKHIEVIDDGLNSFISNKIYNSLDEQRKSYKLRINSLMSNNYKYFITLMYSKQIFSLTSSVFPIIILILGGYKISNNDITVGTLVAFISYTSYLYNPVTVLSKVNIVIKEMKTSIKRVNEILDMETENLTTSENSIKSEKIEKITFRNICYDIDNKSILRNLNYEIDNGKIIAIIGNNGAGKSSLFNLMMRLYDFEGDILINEKSIKDISIEELRDLISIVPQKGFIYSTTIKENIKIANKNATDEEINLVIDLVNLRSFINGLKSGIDSYVFSNEVNLSGGEKQKILLARALIKPSKIMLLDEAMKEIDIESKHIIINNIKKLKNDRTILMITHEESELDISDEILQIGNKSEIDYVLNGGY